MVKPSGEDLHVIADMIATGQVKPKIEATFPLNEGQQAHRMLETGRVRGKLVLSLEEVSSLNQETLPADPPSTAVH